MTSVRRALGEKLFNFEAPDDAGSENDPHTWDDPDSEGLVARLLPTDNPKQKTVAMMVLIAAAGFALYLTRFFPTDTLVVSTALLAGYPALGYLVRKSAWETISDLDWSVLTNGRWAVIRYGKTRDAAETNPHEGAYDDEGIQFEVGKSLGLGGEMNPVEVRDVFGDPTRLQQKAHRTGDTGDTPARDYLPGKFTTTAETETLGTVHVTLTDGLDPQPSSPEVDRAATLPSVLPRSQVGEVKRAVQEYAEIHLPAAEREAEMYERRLRELSQPAEEQVRSYLNDLMRLMMATGMGPRQAGKQLAERDGADPGQQSQGGAGGLPGDMPGQDALDDIDERVNDAMEEEA